MFADHQLQRGCCIAAAAPPRVVRCRRWSHPPTALSLALAPSSVLTPTLAQALALTLAPAPALTLALALILLLALAPSLPHA